MKSTEILIFALLVFCANFTFAQNKAGVVSEWNNQKVIIMGEDDAVMTAKGYEFVRPRQTEFYLIKQVIIHEQTRMNKKICF
ncbi:MAG: hypothetical protein ABIP06_11710 [Pyrinomonadaceae bacterium]